VQTISYKKRLLKYKNVMIFLISISNLVMLIAFFFKLQSLPPQIPLFYSKPVGDSQVADWWFIFLIPLIMNFLYYINGFIYKKFFAENIFIEKVIYHFKIILVISFTLIYLKILFLIT